MQTYRNFLESLPILQSLLKSRNGSLAPLGDLNEALKPRSAFKYLFRPTILTINVVQASILSNTLKCFIECYAGQAALSCTFVRVAYLVVVLQPTRVGDVDTITMSRIQTNT